MKTGIWNFNSFSLIVKKALEGKVSPLCFLLILGFFSSLLLLYISLHVHFNTISVKIEDGIKRREMLSDTKNCLLAERNELASAERIIPIVERSGMKPGCPEQVRRVAYYDLEDGKYKETTDWASSGSAGNDSGKNTGAVKGR
jgi:hypothetical protein